MVLHYPASFGLSVIKTRIEKAGRVSGPSHLEK